MSTAKQQHHATSNRISNLPQNATQQILECLPLQQAARTSVLSKYWRNKWASTSQLILDESFFASILENKSEFSEILLAYNKAVTDIFLSHVGPIGKFVLYIPYWIPKKTDFSSWLRFVYDNGVNDITTKDDRLNRNIPTCFFSFVRLTHLTILNCNFRSLPPTFRGFPCLISLKLGTTYNIFFTEPNVLTYLISKCPLLERLHLSFCECIGTLTIRAPKLREFFFRALQVSDVSLEETTALEVLSLHIYDGKLQQSKNTNDFFSCLANVKRLSLWLFNVTAFASPKMFPKSLSRLQVLKLKHVALNCDSSISFVLCLLLSSPNLEQLHIEAVRRQVESDDQLSQFDDSCIFQCLKSVHLIGITGLSNELKLIRFLLACSAVLDEMTIELGIEIRGAEKQVNFFKELNQYRRASPNAEMIFKS